MSLESYTCKLRGSANRAGYSDTVYGYISGVQLGRGGKNTEKVVVTDERTNEPTDRPSYRAPCTRLITGGRPILHSSVDKAVKYISQKDDNRKLYTCKARTKG